MATRADEASLPENDLLRRKKDDDYTGDGTVDLHGKRVLKRKTGNWKACPFILGTECSERVAYYGISTNLVNYLTGKLHEGNVSAARSVTTWAGTCYLSPLLGAILADAYWGRYWTIALFSTIYFIGMCILALSAAVPALHPAECVGSICPSASFMQYAVFFTGLYLVSLGTGGIKPCVYPFGADQFDCTDPKERVKKGSFFNWFYFVLYIGALVSSTFIVWIQENAGWGLGFGIPALFMGISIASFLSGTSLYRFQKPMGSPVTRLCQVLVASYRKRKLDLPRDGSLLHRTPDKDPATTGESYTLEHTDELRCLDKAAIMTDADREAGDSANGWRLCTVTQVEELKLLIHMVPVWSNFIIFSAVYCQILTMFVEQGMVMNRTVGSFVIPAASLSTFEVLSILIFVPVYDKVVVPLVRRCTGKERGFSELQRMGIGLFITIFAMVAAAILESKRLQIARKHGLVDENVAVPLSILWQIPQYFLVGASEVFGYIGQMEFFYNQAPGSMRSVCSAFFLLNIGLGNYLSSLLVTVLSAATTAGGKVGWLPDNLNKGHLDYFFWLLAGLSFLNLIVYLVFSMRYKQKKTTAPY